ncbi:MAG: L-serine ammonia-lyase, iron-sulfur-dependent, subunit beta, partial [Enterococcus hulanensis]
MEVLKYRSVFDIIGPVMVGPSSSHTAGAARIGKVCRM